MTVSQIIAPLFIVVLVLGVYMQRAATVGAHPRFVRMIRELIVERMTGAIDRPALGQLGPSHDVCPENCCLYTPTRPPG